MRFWRKHEPEQVVRKGIEDVFPRLLRYCLVLSGNKDHAEDLAQAACLRALQQADKFEAGTHFDRWMFRLTQRLWIDEVRKIAVHRGGGLSPIDEDTLVDLAPNPEQAALHREVLASVMQLPEAQRSAVVLVYVEGNSYRDAADILDIPIGTIMSRLSVARSKLVATYQDQAEVG